MIYEGTHQVTEAVPEAYAYLFLPLGFLVPAIAGVFPVWLWVVATFLQMCSTPSWSRWWPARSVRCGRPAEH